MGIWWNLENYILRLTSIFIAGKKSVDPAEKRTGIGGSLLAARHHEEFQDKGWTAINPPKVQFIVKIVYKKTPLYLLHEVLGPFGHQSESKWSP